MVSVTFNKGSKTQLGDASMHISFKCGFEVVLCESDVRFCHAVVLLATVAWKITNNCRQFQLSGYVFFCRQLHVLLLVAVAAVVSSVCIDAVRMRLLWLSIICFVLFMHL